MMKFARWLLDQGVRFGDRTPTAVGLGLRNYLSVTKPGGFARQLILDPVAAPSDTSIGALWVAIRDSLERNQEEGGLSWGEDEPVAMLKATFAAVSGAVNAMQGEYEVSVESLARAMGEAEGDGLRVLDDLYRVEQAEICTGNDNEVRLKGLMLLPASGTCTDGRNVYVCRFGGFAPIVDRLRYSHVSELKRTKSYVFACDAGILVVIPDDVIRATYEGVNRRSELWERRYLRQTDQSVVEGLADRVAELRYLRGDPQFNQAVRVLQANHRTSGSLRTHADFERCLIRWLSLFANEEAATLLQVIAAHRCITPHDVNDFIQGVSDALTAGHFLFTTKRTDDMGGVQRLFTLTVAGQNMFRTLALDTAIKRICEFGRDALPVTLTILTENILSGTQLRRALLCHYLADVPAGAQFVEGARLHALPIEPAGFRAALNRFDRIQVLAAAYTERGWESVRDGICNRLEIDTENVTIRGRVLDYRECFFESSPVISADTKRAFVHIAGDVGRLQLLFDFPDDDVSCYERSLRELATANLLVRPNSVPKRVCGIFTMAPRNRNIFPLFRRIPEHDG